MTSNLNKTLMLGSAQWGWNVSRAEAFRLLDTWIEAGRREIDCATNYPINRNPADFRASEKILHEYVRAHGLRDLRITMKIGSLDNMRSPEVNLAPSFILMMGEEYFRVFGENLHCLMFHWDNRDNEGEIRESLEALKTLQSDAGIRPGISGIRYPEIYERVNSQLSLEFDIQLKHNVFQSDFERYAPFFPNTQTPKHSNTQTPKHSNTQTPKHPNTQTPKHSNTQTPKHSNTQTLKHPNTQTLKHSYFAYGINGGGAKLDEHYTAGSVFLARGGQPEKVAATLEKIRAVLPDLNTAFVRPPVKAMSHVGLIYAGLHPGLGGILIGVSSVSQLVETLDFWRNLETFDYGDVFLALDKIARSSRFSGTAGNH